ncbi:saccharopine dehydrogenase [Gammaproteobacteria bacterium 45_16_T64]|mgnify:CR=1 FL=1|nr:saccharopine dehydrogenase [Gammaproteobacteria bacterium 45_16_T64]
MSTLSRVLVVGAGKIGAAIVRLLAECGSYQVTVADRDLSLLEALRASAGVSILQFEVSDSGRLSSALENQDAVVSACSYDVNPCIAQSALEHGCSYFDLTEDVGTTEKIQRIASKAVEGQVFMPQCGLAPGFIGILAYNLAAQFEEVVSVNMRVGALPKYPTNKMMYNLTWSTDGLINEYCNLCEAIEKKRRIKLVPLEGLECFSLDGVEYEAFNTSGGLGTLCETMEGQVDELNYKTVRYKGHQYLMQFLMQDLHLDTEERRPLLKQIMETSVPITKQDVVLTFVSVKGYRDGRLEQSTDARKIYHQYLFGEHWSSIQITTASSLCAVLDLHFENLLPSSGFVRQEQVELHLFESNRFGRVYQNCNI